jgi:hypothetical protein
LHSQKRGLAGVLRVNQRILQHSMPGWRQTSGSAGEWRGLQVAIKTIVFQASEGDNRAALVASEAAIASNLAHRNIVATYSHDLRNVTGQSSRSVHELAVFKFYLIQVRTLLRNAWYKSTIGYLHAQQTAPPIQWLLG